MIHTLKTKYKGEDNYTISYFVWGEINGETKSVYYTPDQLANFMIEQNFNKSQIKQVNELWGMRGIEFDRGFTIERKLILNDIRDSHSKFCPIDNKGL